MITKNWKKEIARDIMALGSIPFYFIVMIRAVIGKFSPFLYHLGIALLVLVILSKLTKNSNQHIARGLILLIFTSFFYQAMWYTIFATLLWVTMILSLSYLKVKNKEIVKGIIFGVISIIVSHALTSSLITN